ncbi:tetratricopeptide repeat protein [Tolypothrix sp. PCC 7910]|uniref:tetratricopeptide repeat protein n=1 Tax=Tolypothrix sp. PCC 7910 TaxID=2099387 RepID=UPI001FCA53B4|nr:tetratricopeptide repeat protein [Tolypothrix sp. PCC 7910]
MQVIHLELKHITGDYVELRYFVDNPNEYEKRSLPLSEIADLNEQRKSLQNYDEELKFRLRRVLQQLHEGGKSFLLVLDDFEVNLAPRNESYVLQAEVAEVLKALVWAIRENYTSHRIIITCRYDFEFSQLQYFYKQPLDALQGADLQKKFNRLTAFGETSQVDEALKLQAQKLADGNPRLLEWLDKILQNKTVDRAAILNSLETDRQVELREQVLAEALLQQMDETMREMLSRGLVFELPVPREALAAVCENIPNLEHYINRAVVLGLLEVSYDEVLRVPRILPVQLPGDGEALYKQAAEVLYCLWWEEAESATEEQLLEIHRLALRGKLDKIAVKIAGKLARNWKSQSRFREALKLCKYTLELAEDYLVLHELARSEQELGEVIKAQEHYQKALENCPAEDEQEKAAIIHNLGYLKANSGEINEAIALFKQSLTIKEQIGDVQGKAATLHELGTIKANTGEINEAIALYEQSLALTEEISEQATTLHCLGTIKINRGEINEAIALFEKSLAIKEQIGDVQGMARSLSQLGIIKANSGKVTEAITLYKQSLILKQQIGDIQGQATTLHYLGIIKADRGEINEAIALYAQSLALDKQIGNVRGQAATLHNLGIIKANQGEIKEAIALYEQSLILTEQIGNVQGQARTLSQLGIVKANNGDIAEAITLYTKSLTLKQQIGDVQGQATTLHELGRLKANMRKFKEAITLFQHSLAINNKIGYVQGEAMTLWWLGSIAAQQGNYNQALDYLQPALEIMQRIKSPHAEEVRQIVERILGLIGDS